MNQRLDEIIALLKEIRDQNKKALRGRRFDAEIAKEIMAILNAG